MSEWDQVERFESQENCENYRVAVIAAEKSDSENVYNQRYSYSICVREDDPRLTREIRRDLFNTGCRGHPCRRKCETHRGFHV